MNAIIIEDEKVAARRLARMVKTHDVKVLCMLHSVKDSIQWFQKNQQPDILFLDIQLSDGISFEIFEQVNIDVPIIFTTAYDEFALKAFKLNAVDYLLKPIDEEELIVALEKFKRNNMKNFDISSIKSLLQPTSKTYKQRFTVKIGQRLKIVPTKEIECLYSENKASYMYTVHNQHLLLDHSLEYWITNLDPKKFFRVNRTHIIHIKAIKDMISYSNSRLKIILNNYTAQEIVVSRERVKDFKDWLN